MPNCDNCSIGVNVVANGNNVDIQKNIHTIILWVCSRFVVDIYFGKLERSNPGNNTVSEAGKVRKHNYGCCLDNWLYCFPLHSDSEPVKVEKNGVDINYITKNFVLVLVHLSHFSLA